MRLFILALLLLFFTITEARLYKYTDENGIVHYTDRPPINIINKKAEPKPEVPPETPAVKKEPLKVEKLEVRKLDNTKIKLETEAEVKARQEREKQTQRNKLLLQMYPSAEDIILQRDNKVGIIDKTIEETQQNTKDSKQRIEELMTYTRELTLQGRSVPPNTTKEMTQLWQQIDANEQYIKQQEKEKQKTIKKYNQDFEYFRRLQKNTRY